MENPIFVLNTYWNVKFPVSSGSSSGMNCSLPSIMNYRPSRTFRKATTTGLRVCPSFELTFIADMNTDEAFEPHLQSTCFLSSLLLVQNWHVWAPTKPARLSPATENFHGYSQVFQVNPVTDFDETTITYFHILYNSLCLNVPAIKAVQSDLQKKSWNKSQAFTSVFVRFADNKQRNELHTIQQVYSLN